MILTYPFGDTDRFMILLFPRFFALKGSFPHFNLP
jgi:hypothetical protein